ncbi:hypothetical protein DFH11DRAFT_551441 [Phellopilus nigrolimitatus]|nr:hypothetical protein DFH11DRAFT_551441 [Phellopilus nigrolimitatus]
MGQVQTAVVDSKCQELLTLLAKARNKGATSVRELIAYRREAEQYVGQDEHLYRVEWDQGRRAMRVWLLAGADTSMDLGWYAARKAEGLAAARWRAYAESYVLAHPTELVDEERVRARMRRPFLARCVYACSRYGQARMLIIRAFYSLWVFFWTRTIVSVASVHLVHLHLLRVLAGVIYRTKEECDEEAAGGAWVPERGLAVGVQPGTYKLVYQNGSGDAGLRVWPRATEAGDEEGAVVRRRVGAWEEGRARSWIAKSYF